LYELIFNVDAPFERNLIIEDSLNIVFVLPELQPRLCLVQADNIKFVGPALDESVRLQMSDTYSSLINEFIAKNTNPIIYVSMGTVFNFENSDLFQVIVEACKSFLSTHSVIVSTGDEKTYAKYSKSSQNNVIFVPHAPQIEILKRLIDSECVDILEVPITFQYRRIGLSKFDVNKLLEAWKVSTKIFFTK
jgi:UDP:flavonoid glycosyltransferase YjiC (YdhE family)